MYNKGGHMRPEAVRLPDDILHKLEKIAKQLSRTKSYIIRKAIEIYVKDHADYQIALDRLNDKDDEIISSKDMRKLLEK